MREINPAKGGDFDLLNYKKKLITKIKVISKASFWMPILLIYFISGYDFDLWASI